MTTFEAHAFYAATARPTTLLRVHSDPPSPSSTPAPLTTGNDTSRRHPWDPTAPSNAFEREPGEYAQVRPSYPAAAVAAALGEHFEPEQWVADVGAGTGKLTAQLLAHGARVYALEPAAAMRRQFETTLAPALSQGRVRLLEATAENTGLEHASVNVLTYAQCWHWLKQPQALAEAARILQPGGRLAIIVNQMRVEVPWVHRLTRIMRSGDVYRADKPPQLGANFTPVELQTFNFTTALIPEQVMALARTRSSYLRSNSANRAKMQANLHWYLRDYLGYGPLDQVEIPYSTLTWTAQLR